MPRDFALVIGIGDYPIWNRPLRGAKDDAADFLKWLCDQKGGGLDPEDAKLVQSKTTPYLVPVQEEIDAALAEIKSRSAAGARRFYFYFAGHGMGEDSKELALCLPRWSDDWRGAALCMEGYLKVVVELGAFSQVVCFLDCCRVREKSIGCNGPQVRNVKPKGEADKFIAYATEFDNLAYEAAVNSGGPVRGHFTRALMEALRGAASGPSSPGVSPSRLRGYVIRRTTELAQQGRQTQNAHIPLLPAEEEKWTFGKYPPSYTVEIRFSQGLVGPISLSGPDGNAILRGTASDTTWRQPLEPAWHVIKDHGTGREMPFRVIPQEGSGVQIVEF